MIVPPVRPPVTAPILPPPLPPSKKEMARKRTFGEIVDLTQDLSDGEEDYHRAQRARLEAANLEVASDTVLKPSNQQTPCRGGPERGSRVDPNSAPMTDDDNLDLSKFKYGSTQRALLHDETIVQPMNKRKDALRRDRYNAKTIARDILVACGKHPTMAPLNYHLENLRKKFRHVDNNSDLSTFRWDLVDPGGPSNDGGAADDETNDADDEGAALEESHHDGQSLLSTRVQIASNNHSDEGVITG